MNAIGKIAALLTLALALASCSPGVTETGNPSRRSLGIVGGTVPVPSPSPSPVDPPPHNSGPGGAQAQGILTAICDRLSSCNPSLSVSDCTAGILPTSSIDTELGLPDGFGTYGDIVTAEMNRAITANVTAAQNCVSDINALSCSDSGLIAAYNPAAPNDFSNAYRILPATLTSCGGVFR